MLTQSDEAFLDLQSISLNSPNTTLSPLYDTLLKSSAWAPRLSVLATLGDNVQDPHGSHRVIQEAWGSTGCVNALDWERTGQCRLASAGDDTKINIWSPGLDHTSNLDMESHAPKLSYGLSEVIDTGHRANIFSIKWAPSSSSRLFSCAGDSTARVFDISLATNPNLTSSTIYPRRPSQHPPWTHHGSATACTRVLRCHTGRVKRVATETSPDVFLTCSEDGTVRQHDLRMSHVCRQPGERHRSSGCPPPLVEYDGLSLYSLSLSKLRPHLFAVAGTGPYVYLHDRRMLRGPMKRDWGIDMNDSGFTQCVRRFGVPKPDGTGEISNHVVATKLSATNSRDLLVSYSGDGVYLFDTDAEPEPVLVPSISARKPSRRKDKESSKEELRTAAASSTVPEKRPREDSQPATPAGGASHEELTGEAAAQSVAPQSPPIGPHEHEAASGDREAERTEINDGEEAEAPTNGEHDEDSDEEDMFTHLRRNRRRAFHPEVPLVAPRHVYEGHLNESTVKDVNFMENHVVSGSDDGNYFVWNKDTEELVAIYHGDDNVVNVLQPHPYLPLLAISGIDPTVKIFGPVSNPLKSGNLVTTKNDIIERNKARAGQEGDGEMLTAEDLVTLLYSRMSPHARGRVRLAFAGQGREGGGDDSDEVQECSLM